MIGVCAERLYWRISLAVSKPSMSGMLTSSRIAANSVLEDLLQRLGARADADQVVAEVLEDGVKTSSFSGRSSTMRMLARSPSSCAEVVELRVQRHSQPLSTASRFIGSTGFDR